MPHHKRNFIFTGVSAAIAGAFSGMFGPFPERAHAADPEVFEVTHTDAEWRRLLDSNQYVVLRKESTETPFTHPLNHESRSGKYACAGCGLEAFSSRTKFDSGTGWPSFWQPLPNAVAERRDATFGFVRTEVHCRRCGGHFGHVFKDGPKPTGLRYCMNGVSLVFAPGEA